MIKTGMNCKRLTMILVALLLTYVLVACNSEHEEVLDPMQINAMTFNMKFENQSGAGADPVYTWERRLPGIIKALNDYKVHIVGTQELMTWQYNQVMSQLGDDWSGFGLSRGNSSSEKSAILYRNDVFELLEQHTIWLSSTPNVAGSSSWNSAHPRILTYGKFKHLASDIEIYFFNTHLDHQSNLAKLNQLDMAVNKLLEVTDYPTLFTGDFNMYPNHENMAPINAQSDLFTSAFEPFSEKFDPNGRTAHGFLGTTEGLPIDYIYYSQAHFSLLSTDIIRDRYQNMFHLSDHFPVLSKFLLSEV